MVTPAFQQEAVRFTLGNFDLSERQACELMNLARSTFRSEPLADKNVWLRARIKALAAQRRRFGSRRIGVLLKRKGETVNHKRVERIYRQEGLSLHKRRKMRQTAALRVVLPTPVEPN